MSGAVDVRRVGAEAAREVWTVVEAAFGARPALDPPADALADDVETVAAELADHGGLLAERDGEPVGALLLRPTADALWLRRFGVVPPAQGDGVATALVQAALDQGLGWPALAVLAREDLPETVSFWERQGFTESARRTPYVELRRALPTTWDVPDPDAMHALGARVARSLVAGDVVVLTGELGAGKTTFTQGLGEGLGVRGGVTSPTFVIARVHPALDGGPDLVHVDAYRLGGIDELDDLDLDTSLDTAVTVVEWGSGMAEGLSDSRLEVVISRSVGAAGETGATSVDGDAPADPRRVELRRVAPTGTRLAGE
jgi:tRNA threonylcarbamoyladenosine biosynthesis protein TsaE